MTVLTDHPSPPLDCLGAIRGIDVRFGGGPASWAGMAGPTGIFRMEAQAKQMTLVPKELPNFPADGRVVAIVAPAPANAFAPSCGFERFQGLHRQQRAPMDLAQQQQDITGQVSQGPIALLIFAPTPIDFTAIKRQSLDVPCSFGVIFWQHILFVCGDLLLEFINLSAGAGLPTIKLARVEEKGPANLLAV